MTQRSIILLLLLLILTINQSIADSDESSTIATLPSTTTATTTILGSLFRQARSDYYASNNNGGNIRYADENPRTDPLVEHRDASYYESRCITCDPNGKIGAQTVPASAQPGTSVADREWVWFSTVLLFYFFELRIFSWVITALIQPLRDGDKGVNQITTTTIWRNAGIGIVTTITRDRGYHRTITTTIVTILIPTETTSSTTDHQCHPRHITTGTIKLLLVDENFWIRERKVLVRFEKRWLLIKSHFQIVQPSILYDLKF